MAATYHVYVGNFGMNMNPNFNVIYLVNNHLNLQLRNMEPYDHAILAFIIPVLLTLVQIRYPADQDLFQAHPTAMKVLLSCLLAYCLAFGILGYFNCVDFVSSRTILAASSSYFVGRSVAAVAGVLPETVEDDMSNFAADFNGFVTK
ncbi:PREDICTED: L484_002648 [Prunus dulcis]|uniref:PREDICTED: L484_002648 n=1 Tax=Prunus dulcis TaxID=3755 RepID=A0A5E4GKZ9_PRUDU|nr:PREDICTED: L484_002648 [Prunus dulcis]